MYNKTYVLLRVTRRGVTDALVTASGPRVWTRRSNYSYPFFPLGSSLGMARGLNTKSRGSFRGSRGNSSFRGFRGRGRGGSSAARSNVTPKQDDEGTRLAERFEQVQLYDDIDDKLGFARIQEGPKREGWLVNMHPVEYSFSIQYPWHVRNAPVSAFYGLGSWDSSSEAKEHLSMLLLHHNILTDLPIRRS